MMASAYTPAKRLKELTGGGPWQIDCRAIWATARKMFYGGDLSGGLQMDEGFDAMIKLGWLPTGATLKRLPANAAEVAYALRFTPVCQGTATHQGWMEPDGKSGQIGLHYIPDPYAGHFTVIVAAMSQGGRNYLTLQNSWGASWGRYGYGVLREDQWLQMLLDDPLTADVPKAWWADGEWAKGIIIP